MGDGLVDCPTQLILYLYLSVPWQIWKNTAGKFASDGLDWTGWILLRSLVQLEHLAVLTIILFTIVFDISVQWRVQDKVGVSWKPPLCEHHLIRLFFCNHHHQDHQNYCKILNCRKIVTKLSQSATVQICVKLWNTDNCEDWFLSLSLCCQFQS